ncbi:MAG: T9SS type A sorting domain-containing protein [Saprospiraceae bacterium]|nr:T9SS type A sorting domain-containing protein [Saprospiraceae bacterium]MCF8251852.1 T9SS type A sorting domain-containing protein [Saprospiraceae bacterium]MCF8282788.1 T9SS type A sorting domain-containing protein [Bacteroidales bacterium]MCF8313326.1 T9SS type A sorting domain-containing protein [Saprospiraceae bacterium]MCF8441718.1 T9SS type A sorting domain-containing protein [Saprospiraceae bacterium]
MRPFLFLFFVCSTLSAFAQKEDYFWFFGSKTPPDSIYSTCTIDFNNSPPQINLRYEFIGFNMTNASISDSLGNLLCYTNGAVLFNAVGDVIENGHDLHSPTSFPFGFTALQGGIIFPFPDHADKFIFISGVMKLDAIADPHLNPMTYTTIDMTANNGAGEVIEKNMPFNYDTLHFGKLHGLPHANGRDWWLVVPPDKDKNEFYKFLITPNGVSLYDKQQLGDLAYPGLGQAVFSPNGEWYAIYDWFGIIGSFQGSSIQLFRFDRCTGQLSDPIKMVYENLGLPGGVAFSANSRFMYVSAWDKIHQFDLWATDVLASKITVAEYDGFLDERGLATRFFTMKLAPDNKIYISVSNYDSRYLHVIDQPDSLGIACNVQQHSVVLPIYNLFSIPNTPVFRIGKMVGSPCDTILSSSVEVNPDLVKFELHPNPASSFVEINCELPSGITASWQLFNIAGQLTSQVELTNTGQNLISLEGLQSGLYVYKVIYENQAVQHGKLVIAK